MTKSNNTPDVLRNFFKRWPAFYYFIALVFGPLMFGGLSAKKFLHKYPRAGKTLNIGSGPQRLGSDIINVDIHPYAGVDIVADGMSVPLPDGSVSRIVSNTVLEHVANPKAAIDEMHRLLPVGGFVYICVPFLYQFHTSPNDFQRWTHEGLRELMKDFTIVEIGVRAGPFSALTVTLCYICATIFSFGSKKLYWILVNVFMVVFFPIKFLDILFNHWPNAINMSAIIYCVAKKR